METRVLAVTASHADEQPDSLHEKAVTAATFSAAANEGDSMQSSGLMASH